MKILIAIMSCHRDRLFNDGCRKTWVRDVVGADVRFFIGRPTPTDILPDEIFLDVDDGYTNLPFKIQAICRWAVENGYDVLFKCDPDTFVVPSRLLRSDFSRFDYLGGNHHGGYASGGSGYFLSRRAMEFIVEAVPYEDKKNLDGEDVQVGKILNNHGIVLREDGRFRLNRPGAGRVPDNFTEYDLITFHPWGVLRIDTIEKMHKVYAEYNR